MYTRICFFKELVLVNGLDQKDVILCSEAAVQSIFRVLAFLVFAIATVILVLASP